MPTVAELTARKALYLAAEARILSGQEYVMTDGSVQRRLRMADLEQVRLAIQEIDAELGLANVSTAGARRVSRIIPG